MLGRDRNLAFEAGRNPYSCRKPREGSFKRMKTLIVHPRAFTADDIYLQPGDVPGLSLGQSVYQESVLENLYIRHTLYSYPRSTFSRQWIILRHLPIAGSCFIACIYQLNDNDLFVSEEHDTISGLTPVGIILGDDSVWSRSIIYRPVICLVESFAFIQSFVWSSIIIIFLPYL